MVISPRGRLRWEVQLETGGRGHLRFSSTTNFKSMMLFLDSTIGGGTWPLGIPVAVVRFRKYSTIRRRNACFRQIVVPSGWQCRGLSSISIS